MKALLFDMDGVLVDVSLSYRLTIKRAVEYFTGQRINFSQIQEYKNRGGMNNDWDLIESILKDYGEKIEKRKIIDVFQEIYRGESFNGLIKNEKWLLDLNVLKNIKRNFKIGIVTGRPRMEASYTLQRFGIEKYFPVLITMDDLPQEKAKPEPFSIELALKRLRTNEAYYFGDTVDDMVAARRANVVPIGVIVGAVGYEKQKDLLLNSGAQWVLKDINDILEVLE